MSRKTPSDPSFLGRLPSEPAKLKYKTKMNSIKHIASLIPLAPVEPIPHHHRPSPECPPQWLGSAQLGMPKPASAERLVSVLSPPPRLTDLYRAV